MSRVRRLATHAGWGLADQVLSSAINFALGVAVARTGTPTEFGSYGLVFAAYLIVINLTRPVGVVPLIIRFSGAPPDEWRHALAASTGVVVVVGVALGVVGLAIGAILGGFIGLAFAIVAVGLPGLVLQDAWRLTSFAARRGKEAFVNDLTWAGASLGTVAIMSAVGATSTAMYLAAWVIGANAAAIVGVLRARVRPSLRVVLDWWVRHRDLGAPLLGESLVNNIANEVIPYVVGAISGLAAVAALRAAQLLLGPFNVVYQGLTLIALPEAVRLAARSRLRLLQAALAFSGTMVLAVLGVGLVVSSLPTEAGVAVLGSTWGLAQEVMLPYTLLIAGMISASGSVIGLRAIGEAMESLVLGLARSSVILAGAVAGALSDGATGAAIGMAIGQWLGSAATWWRFVVRLRGPIRPVDDQAARDPWLR